VGRRARLDSDACIRMRPCSSAEIGLKTAR
jgi:hypothetical protein